MEISTYRLLAGLLLMAGLARGQDIDYLNQLKNKPFISVKDKPYNAKGNGTTNDLTAINAAIVAASSAGGGDVIVPSGTYIINAAITLKSNIKLRCAQGAVIKNNQVHGIVLSINNIVNATVDSCTIIGSNSSPIIPTAATQNVINILNGSSNIKLTNNLIQGCEFACVYMDNISFTTVDNNTFSNLANTTGSILGVSAQTILAYGQITDSTISNNWDVTGTNDVGIQISPCLATTANSTRNTIQNNHVSNKNRYGIILYGHCAVSTQQITQVNILGNFINNISSRVFGASGSSNGMGIYLVDADVINIGYNIITNTLIGRVELSLPTGAISISECYQVKTFFNTVDTSLFSGLWFSQAGRVADPAGIGMLSYADTIKNTGTDGVTIVGSIGTPILNTRLIDIQVYNAAGNGIGLVAYAPNTTITGATIISSGVAGVSTENTTSAHLTVVNSRILNSGTRGILSQGDSPIINNNRISDGIGMYAGIDISTAGAGTGGVLNGNEVYNNYNGIAADVSLPGVSFIGNVVYSNSNSNWSLGSLRTYSAKGNTNLPDHTHYTGSVTTSAIAINAGACVLEASFDFVGTIGLPGTGASVPSVIYPTSLPSNWIYLTHYVSQSGSLAEFIQCNPTVGTITPTAAIIVFGMN